MRRIYYQEQVLENIARQVLCGYDSELYYGSPSAVPIEEIIESNGVSLEYQYLRKQVSRQAMRIRLTNHRLL